MEIWIMQKMLMLLSTVLECIPKNECLQMIVLKQPRESDGTSLGKEKILR